MGIDILTAVALLTLSGASDIAAASPPVVPPIMRSTATRFDGGSASVMVRARIVRDSASIGARFGPPVARMTPRTATLTAANGQARPALIYDFE